ncbi:hypothetical protein DFH08DRAFT_971797 [Mycena albidolilacea]|uniref:Uncharacterized protein n=1 Tax=Mycena albidolilacea TaxID=1033008 RepID=A0AAD6ZCW1_9AGAR|nr:hypothetical protein DFH08DRAFT_971797 [Mycena albidolilacea]
MISQIHSLPTPTDAVCSVTPVLCGIGTRRQSSVVVVIKMLLPFFFVIICCLGPTEFLQVTACYQGVKLIPLPDLARDAKFSKVEAEEDVSFVVKSRRGASTGAHSTSYARHW